jgi:hypothetical protein
VFPCDAKKRPASLEIDGQEMKLSWTSRATNDPQEAEKLFNNYGGELIGIACALSDVFALDVDNKDGRAGSAELEELERIHGPLNAAVIQRTPSGGYHFLFSHPDCDIVQSPLTPGIDTRSKGYICTGPGYTWEPGHGPENELTPAPAWVFETMLKKKEKVSPAATVPQSHPLAPNLEGWLQKGLSRAKDTNHRNDTGYWLAQQLRDDGIGEAEASSLSYPELVFQKSGNPYTRDEWEESVKSAYNSPRREPARNINKPMTPITQTAIYPHFAYMPEDPPPWEEMPSNLESESKIDSIQTPNQTPNERPRYVIRTAADALTPRPPIEFLIDGVLSKGSLNVWVGKFGSKKTQSIISAAVCTALGKPWLGFNTQQCVNLIIDEESGDDRLSRRLGMAIKGELGGPDTPVLYVSLAQFNLFKNPNDAILLQALIEETHAGAVWIDALADIMAGGDENSVKDTQPVFMQLRKIAETTKAAITVIHHTNKVGDYRGSSAIPGAIDTMILVDSETGSKFVNFKTLKNRDGEPLQFSGEANWSDDQFWMGTAENQAEKAHMSKSQAYVMRILEGGPMPLSNIMSCADVCSSNAARQAVYSLSSAGKVYRTNPGERGQGTEAIYAIKPEPEPEF